MFDGYEVLGRRLERARRISRETAELLVEIAEFVAAGSDEFARLEVAAAFGWSVSYAQSRIALAVALTTRFPATLAVLRAGEIQEFAARRTVEAVEVLSDAEVARVEAAIAAQAAGLSGRQLSYRLRRAVLAADPGAAVRRAAAQSAARRVSSEHLEDGAAVLSFHGDVERVDLARDRVRAIARQIKSAGDDRTLDQIMADVGLDCLASKGFENAKVHVYLTLPASTVLGAGDKPGYLAGYGWLPAQRALVLAAQEDAMWQRVLTDPLTGHAVDVGRRRYSPPAALRDHVRAVYPTCTGPGCVRPAHLCDLDHVTAFPAGATDRVNVRPACRSHHRVKTHGGAGGAVVRARVDVGDETRVPVHARTGTDR
jgi:hypothetical protein